MLTPRIIAGQVADINRDSGQWLIVDVGFSSTEPTSGVWNGTGEPHVVTFGDLVELATREVRKASPQPLNLLLEAPLSVAFHQNGNPTRRCCDTYKGKHRDWYVNAGATTLIAACRLLWALHRCERQRDVRLFEGFASFKSAQDTPKTKAAREEKHKDDALDLKNAVWTRHNAELFDPGKLRQHPTDCIESAFPFLDEDLVPPVIRINPVS